MENNEKRIWRKKFWRTKPFEKRNSSNIIWEKKLWNDIFKKEIQKRHFEKINSEKTIWDFRNFGRPVFPLMFSSSGTNISPTFTASSKSKYLHWSLQIMSIRGHSYITASSKSKYLNWFLQIISIRDCSYITASFKSK